MSRPFLYPCHRDSGSILVFCLWVLVFFSILSVGIYGIVSSQIRVVKAAENGFFSEWLARSAVIYAAGRIEEDQTFYDTLYELNREQSRQLGKGEFIYTISDEEGKININTSSTEVIARLPNLDADLAEAVAESPLRPFHAKGEILSIAGITEDIFNELKGIITIHSAGRVNINTAPLQVLNALGFDDYMARAVCDFRKGPDGEEGTEDDGIFESAGALAATLNNFRSLSEIQADILSGIMSQGLLGVNSDNFSLLITTKISNRAAMKYEITISGGKIKQWKEY